DLPHGLEDARHALRVELAGEHRLVPRRRHERHRGEVVELARPHRVDDLDERQLIEEVGRVQVNAIEHLLDAPVIRRAGAADDRVDLVALVEQELREVRAVLAGDAGDERLHLNILRYHRAASAAPYAAQPVQYAAGIDHASAMQTDSTDATTDAAPLSPQSHGVSAAARPLADAAFIPIGNAMPSSRPAGNSSASAAATRTGVEPAAVARTTIGVATPMATSTASSTPSRIAPARRTDCGSTPAVR